ncbi:MAG: hypothetical protein K940chlam6_00980 [Chlamydiae bacterium]|nr:hypothetical protein [Chlamydiota bacterium]
MIILAKMIHWVFLIYTILLLVRIIGSWFPKYAYHPIMRLTRFYTDPYLNIFRRFIPPIGGTLDLSPMIAFFVLQFLEKMVLGFLSALL